MTSAPRRPTATAYWTGWRWPGGSSSRPAPENVLLCDASAVPSSTHVNPQLTVMSLAEYAARRVLGPDLPTLPVTARA